MAKNKRHITNSRELEQALRIVGGTFPNTIEELDQTYKLVDKDELQTVASKYSFEDIWNAQRPIRNNKKVLTKTTEIQLSINESWGMAARGSIKLSDDVLKKMKENEDKL